MSDWKSRERWSEDRLLREANRGDTDAFLEFCMRVLPTLRRYVRYQCYTLDVPLDLADDFCHDTLIRAVYHINDCKEHGDRPLPKVSIAWLKMISCNGIRDWKRKNTRVVLEEAVEVEAPPIVGLEEREEYEEILKFFQWLTDNERDMLELVLVESMSITEAGGTLNLTEWNSYKTYERGLEHLRDLLKEHGRKLPSWISL